VDMNETEAILAKMIELFGADRLADPDVYPRQFEYQMKLAKFEMGLKK
jgi:hypothetical protein